MLARLNGVSLPIVGGISWTPGVVDEDVARSVIAYLEDRRALYNPYEIEVADHVIASIIDIRRFLTEVIGRGGIAPEMEKSLRSMRGACREFLNEAGMDEARQDVWVPGGQAFHNGFNDYRLNQALGKLRGIFGQHVGALATKFELDIEDELASILPPPAE